MLIAIEGIDGAGKNTLVGALTPMLKQAGARRVELISFPRYAEADAAKLAAAALHGQPGAAPLADSAWAMAGLFALDRAGCRDKLVDADSVILLDRYVASNAAYTSARLGSVAAAEEIAELEFGRLGLPKPTLTVLLDTAPETASARAQSRERSDATRTRDRYEKDAGLQQTTHEAYLRLANNNWHGSWLVTSDPRAIVDAAVELAPETFR